MRTFPENSLRYTLVWKEAASLFAEMVKVEGWNDDPVIILDPVNQITTKVCLLYFEGYFELI